MPVQIGGVTYTAKDLDDACKAGGEVSGGFLDELFGDSVKLWKFTNKSLFFSRLVTFKDNQWKKGKSPPAEATAQYQTPTGGEQAGTVVIGLGLGKGSVTFNNSKELLEHELFRIFSLAGDDLDRVRMLAADPHAQKWTVPGWPQLENLLEFWKRNGVPPQNWFTAESAAGEFLAYRTAQRVMSVKEKYDPDKKVGCKTNELAAGWSNCGQVATNLMGRIGDLGGEVEKTYVRAFIGSRDAADLVNVLTADVSEATLVHLSNPILHEFTIERRPGAGALLQQGYQGAYSALWWAGLDGITSEEFTLTGLDAEKMQEAREKHGKGALIDLPTFASKLAAFLAGKTIGHHEAQVAWKELPFYAAQRTDESAVPEWEVTIWVVRKPEAVLSALGDKVGQHEWLTMAVLAEAAEVWRAAM